MKEIIDAKLFTNLIWLHFRIIFRNKILEKNIKSILAVSKLIRKIVEETELPDLPRTSVSYKIINRILPHVDWIKLAEDSLAELKDK